MKSYGFRFEPARITISEEEIQADLAYPRARSEQLRRQGRVRRVEAAFGALRRVSR